MSHHTLGIKHLKCSVTLNDMIQFRLTSDSPSNEKQSSKQPVQESINRAMFLNKIMLTQLGFLSNMTTMRQIS